MHPAIEAYKKRRKDRLVVASFKERRQKRLDAADPKSWITVNGTHVPLDDEGKAIGGGGLAGKEFKDAKSVKPSPKKPKYERPAAQDKAIKRLAKRTANLKNEQYRIVDKDGKVVLEKKGDRHSVAATVGEKREYLKDAVSLHNHPDGGTFSPDDLSDFGYGATEMIIATPEGTYTLTNLKVGEFDQYSGWHDMRTQMENEIPTDVSFTTLQKQAQENLKNCEERVKMAEINEQYLKMHDNGASREELNEFYQNSGYDDLNAAYKERLASERRRLETEPFDTFYKENASKYGFEYKFEPAERHDSLDSDRAIHLYEQIKKRHEGRKTVEAYRQRRDERRKPRLDEKPASWITVNGNHIPLDAEGSVIGGQPKSFGEMSLKAVNNSHRNISQPKSAGELNRNSLRLAKTAKNDFDFQKKISSVIDDAPLFATVNTPYGQLVKVGDDSFIRENGTPGGDPLTKTQALAYIDRNYIVSGRELFDNLGEDLANGFGIQNPKDSPLFNQREGLVDLRGRINGTSDSTEKERLVKEYRDEWERYEPIARDTLKTPEDCVTAEDFEDYLHSKHYFNDDDLAGALNAGERISFNDCDTECALATVKAVDGIYADFPMLKGFAGSLAVQPPNTFSKPTTYGHSKDGGDIELNSAFFAAPKHFLDALRDDVSTHFHPNGTDKYESVVYHEFTHRVTDWLDEYDPDGEGDVCEKILDSMVSKFRARDEQRLEGSISRYSYDNQNPHVGSEFVAECFASYYCNEPSARPDLVIAVHDEVVRLCNEWYNESKIGKALYGGTQ